MVLISSYNMQDQRLEILEENYQNIKQILCQVVLSKEKLELIKSKFKDYISSVRRYENINDMKELFKILEKRCVIGYDNIVNIYFIAENVDNSVQQKVGKLLINHSCLLSKFPPAPIHLSFYDDTEICNTIEFSLPNEVIECISSNITRYWLQLARELQIINEKKIDEIDQHDGNKTRKCLEIFVHEAKCRGISNAYETLLRALEVIKRRDIKEQVESILMSSFKKS